MHHTLITELPSRLINQHQVQGGDLMVVPVGSVEVLGPHLPLGARGFVAEAFARLLAEAVGGLTLPLLPLTPLGPNGGLVGSIDVDEGPVNHLLRGLLDDLLATGFRRALLVTYLDYARFYIPIEFYEDHQVAAAGIHLHETLHSEITAAGIGEDSVVLGALRILGHEELLAHCLESRKQFLASAGKSVELPTALVQLSRIGIVGARYPKGYCPLPPTDRIDPDKGAELLRRVVAERVPALESLRAYNEYLARRGSRGFIRGSWFRD